MSNEITAYFKGRAGVAESVYQYDYGMVLVIDGLDFVNNFDCYFSTSGEDEAIPAIGSDNRVAIPNSCLTRAGDVTLHIPTHTGENDSEVESVVTFRVIGRARPIDDGTAEEQSAVSKAIALLNHTNSNVIETIDAYLDENAAEPIQEWLDEHPEATTTVQDGAITSAKFNRVLKEKIATKYDSLAELTADTSLVEGQICFVEGLCYEMFDAYNVVFDIVGGSDDRVNEFVSISLDNGLYAIPKVDNLPSELPCNTTSTANAVINTALSYVDRSDFEYGHNTLFATECVKNENEKYEIDCSSLSQASLMGIAYDNSRYYQGNDKPNLPYEWGFKFPTEDLPSSPLSPISRKYGYLASELAFYCYTHGYLYEINELGTNVQEGDIVFEYVDVEGTSDYFMRIGHTGVVMQNTGDGSIRIIEAGVGQNRLYPVVADHVCAIRTYACGGNAYWRWGARIPINANDKSKEITALINNIPQVLSGDITNSNYINFTVYANEVLKKGALYTFELEADFRDLVNDLSSYGAKVVARIRLLDNSGAVVNQYIHTDLNNLLTNDKLRITYTPLRDQAVSSAISIGIRSNYSTSISVSATVYSFRIWEGLPEAKRSVDNSIIEIFPDSQLTVNAIYKRNKKFLLDITVPSIASGVSEISIGNIDVWNATYTRMLGNVFAFAPSKILYCAVYIQRGEIKMVCNATEASTNMRFAIQCDLDNY